MDNLLAEKVNVKLMANTVGGTFRQLVVAKTSWQYGSEVVFVRMPSRQQKRRAKRREEYWNTFKIETVDELESSRFGTMLMLNISGRLLVTVIEVGGGGGGGGGLHTCPLFN